jgi:hypothetical protein
MRGRSEDVSVARLTSRPSQNSASVICPVITRSRCRPARSGFAVRIFFRSRMSSAVSPAAGAGDARAFPACESARGGRLSRAGAGAGVPPGACSGARASCVVTAPGVGGTGGRAGVGTTGAGARLRPRMAVSASLKRARSASAPGAPKTKV